MNEDQLKKTAQTLTQEPKGILAADESNNSCKKRFDALDLECTEESRRQYRQLLLTTPDINQTLSGVILFEETFNQAADDGKLFREHLSENNVAPGIKVDQGLAELPGFEGEKITKGLDSLPERMAEYSEQGAVFAKWRSVITIGDKIPTDACIDANAYVLSRYARICQDHNIVPIVEPEVLFDGTHTIERCQEVVARTYDLLFDLLRYYRVYLPGVILKTGMVLPGKDSSTPIDHQDVAERTVKTLREHVPSELGGVVFLSGGQPPRDAFVNLNRIKQKGPHPWGVTFSYSRALQDPVLKAWAANHGEGDEPKQIFSRQLQYARQAAQGQLDESEQLDDFVSRSQDL